MSGGMKPRIALIPAYEPTDLLPDLLQEVWAQGFEAIVIDDGSGVESKELFQQAEAYATVLHHTANRGKGCAIKTGLAYVLEHMNLDCTIVTLDADGQHRVEDAVRLCMMADKEPGTMVLGCRRLAAGVPARSRFGNTVTRFVFRISTGKSIYDTQTGLRAFGSELIPMLLAVDGERYEYEMNVLLTCAREDVPISEVEIETIYVDGNSSSHFNVIKDSYRVYKEILKFSVSSFVSFLVDYGLYSIFSIATAAYGSAGLIASNIGARIISAGFNFSINRNLVFRSNTHVGKALLRYAVLAAVILAGNTLVLSLLVHTLGVNRYLAKLCTEILFFAISWLVQRCFIFARPKGGDGQE